MTYPHRDSSAPPQADVSERERTVLFMQALRYVEDIAKLKGIQLHDLCPHPLDAERDQALHDYARAHTAPRVKDALRVWMRIMRTRMEEEVSVRQNQE